MLRTMRRKVPWIVVFEAAMMMRNRWKQLPPDDRKRLAELARRSKGNPLNLTRPERAEFRRITLERGLKAAIEWRDARFREQHG